MPKNSAFIAVQLAVLTFLMVGGLACALYTGKSSASVVTTCSIPADQSGTISGQWPLAPIPIAFHQGAFNSAEITAMTSAATTWNTFFKSSQSISVFDFGDANPRESSVSNPTLTGNLCATGIIPGSTYNGNVVVYKDSRWPSAYAATAIALTSFCVLPQTPYPKLYMAIMEMNYQSFFSSGQKQPDLQSIVLHEAGHVLGLNHSCEAFQKNGTPNCNDPAISQEYVQASMYPVFTFDQSGVGQVKQALGVNDQSRANCLYGTAATKK